MKRLIPVWLAVGLTAVAQPMSLSLQQAVDLALAPDGATRQLLAAEAVQQTDARRKQALGALLPNADGSWGYQNFTRNLRAFGVTFPAIPGFRVPEVVGPVDVFDLRATASQSVLDMAAIRRYQAARTAVDVAKAENSSARNLTAAAVARAYVAAQTADANRETAKANVALSEEILAKARSQKEAGTGTGIEIVRAEAQRANERQMLIVAEKDAQTARLLLLRAIGLPLETGAELSERLAFRPVEIPSAPSAIEMARKSRPEFEAQRLRERGAELGYSSVKWERAPSVGAYGDYGTIGTEPGRSLPTRTFGISVKIPVFDGGRRDARRAEAMSQMRQERLRTRDTGQQVELEVRLALESLRTTASQVAVATETLALAERELEQAQRRYEAGVAAGLEVTDAQTRLARARQAGVAATAQHRLARVDYGVAVGSLDLIVQ